MLASKTQIRTDLRILLLIAGMLTIIGLIFIYSSSSVYAMEKCGSSYYFALKQGIGLILGLVALAFGRMLPFEFIKKCSPAFFFGSLGLTAMTMLPGISQRIHGSSRWLNIGGFGFQPSELLKISLVLYLAYFLEKRAHQNSSLTHTYVPLLVILGATCVVLLK
ncbi:MAG: FtsW/RodA/SpoVE family cell cycle protein, partial [Candidatus Babeliales bacterium]|nr:FtsW/RodA/SpoVE family cell cycle protein [Candidatus Babeliales bacterium]